MAERFSLKDHLFNAETIGQLAGEYEHGVPGFDGQAFAQDCLAGFAGRELMERLDWIADQVSRRLSSDFVTMAAQLEAAMPDPLNPSLRDDDFGHFIHAVPGILAVRHGMDDVDRALELLYAATQRFSMEFYIRPFLNAHPDVTLNCLRGWVKDDNYHVRRLVSEGTRARLPWAKRIDLDPLVPLEFLDVLYGDQTRYVTRSVANHLNDIAKTNPDVAISHLIKWRDSGAQSAKEMTWISRHALRTLIKDGHRGTLDFLGYRTDTNISVDQLSISPDVVSIGGTAQIDVVLTSPTREPVIVDYILHLKKSNGTLQPKVFKWKDTVLEPDKPLCLKKVHKFKGDATTFTLYSGPQKVEIQVNGSVIGAADFTLTKD